jgi:2-pyrone-4,6-dicarboxylate lactonase
MSAFHPSPSKPKLKLPRGACDTHFHAVGPRERFPFAPQRSYTPEGDAPKEKLFALHAHLGIERGVVVQSAVHGFDNSVSADLIAAKPNAYRGVALVPIDVADAELKKLSAQGFLSARFHFMKHLDSGVPIEEVIAFGKRLAKLDWHLQLHLDATLIEQMAGALARSPVPIVIDHMARIDASKGLQDPAFLNLLKLMKDKNVWMKVSGSERASKQPAPWKDAVPFARKLVEEFGDRTLWGTDWPHPNLKEVPDDGVLTDLLAQIAPAPKALESLLVLNPAKLYKFEKP